MISPADDHPDARGDTAEVRLAGVFRNARLSEDPRNVRDRPVGADAHVLVDAELEPAHADKARTARGQPFARFVEIRSLLVGVRRDAAADVGSKARHTSRS